MSLALAKSGPVTKVEEPCPECHAQCLWCSDYQFMVRARGCDPMPPNPTGLPRRCKKHKQKGEACQTCGKKAGDGGGTVLVERRIVSREPA